MIYVGIDLHRKRSQITALDEEGAELLSRRVANEPEALRAILAELGGELQVALEATYGWEWLAELLEREGHELHLSHPLRTKAIAAARVKTDAVDARTLAHLLRTDLLPEAYVAPRELRDLRDLLRHRVVLTRMRSALKNRVHALLARQGIQREHADLFGRGGRGFLSELPLREPARRRLDSLLSLISDFDREIEQAKREIDALARHDPRVEVLCQLRGIGPYTAMLVIAEVGEIERFRSARHLCAWAGLTPTVRSSDGRARLGHISRQGSPHIRWALVEAAQKGSPGWRSAARRLRADRETTRPQHRQGRPRPAHAHPLLLRPARRRDPLPPSSGAGARASRQDGAMNARRPLERAPRPGPPLCAARANSHVCLASLGKDGRPLD
jgi:transposase